MNRNVHTETYAYAGTMTKVVDELLVKGTHNGEPSKAIVFGTRIDFNNFHGNEEQEPDPVGGYLHVACYAPRNYVHVLAAFTERPITKSMLVDLDWQPIACHDSCWREDGVKSVIVDAVRILNKAALETFKILQDNISFHLALEDLFIGVENADVVLDNGLKQDNRHGKLTIPGHGTWRRVDS